MMERERSKEFGIWALALGYFCCYIPYSSLVKALADGALPGMTEGVSGLELLPATVLATAVTMLLIITWLGWWKYPSHRACYGLRLPWPGPWTALSGLCFAIVIATTTLAYTFAGISIVFALLLMRGGVLIIAPITDALCKRQVHWYSWAALELSLVALGVAFTGVGSYTLSLAALVNLSAYLLGYVFRLYAMTTVAKSTDAMATRRYFVEEQMVAMLALVLVPALCALVGVGDSLLALRRGFTTFLGSPPAAPALLVGVCYAALGTFGTLIYLDRRENTFAIPVNRGSSLLSGVVASYALMYLLGQQPVPLPQLLGAGMIILAMLCLSLPTLMVGRPAATVAHPAMVQRLFLFVCSGNTSRSPMAQAICNAEIARWLKLPLTALSAGLSVQAGAPMTPEAQRVLGQLGVPAAPHEAQKLTDAMVRDAEAIWCMTEGQCQTLVVRHPTAAGKIYRLDPERDINDPTGLGPEAFLELGWQLQQLVRYRLREVAAVAAVAA
jgi:protein-tyrosine-phosphatase